MVGYIELAKQMKKDWEAVTKLEKEQNELIQKQNTEYKQTKKLNPKLKKQIDELEVKIEQLKKAKNNCGKEKKLWILIDEFNTSCL